MSSSPVVLSKTVPAEILHQLAHRGKLYAILDACDAPQVPVKVAELGPERALCLYQGPLDTATLSYAPYLVALDRDTLDWLLENLWHDPWGIFSISNAGLITLRRHFRKFLTVSLPGNRPAYFRYYDPRVLQVFVPSCNEQELNKIFGPVDALGLTHSRADKKEAILFTRAS